MPADLAGCGGGGYDWGMARKQDNPTPWRLQLRLSTALLLVALSAVVCAWVTDHRQLRGVINEDAHQVKHLEYSLRFYENHARATRAELDSLERDSKVLRERYKVLRRHYTWESRYIYGLTTKPHERDIGR